VASEGGSDRGSMDGTTRSTIEHLTSL